MDTRDRKPTQSTTVARILLETGFLGIAVAAVGLFKDNAVLMTAIVCANLGLRFALIGRSGDWIFFLIGCIGAGGNDLLSMIKGVYHYTPPALFRQMPIPEWMLLFWGHVLVALRQLFQLPAFQSAPMEKPWKLDRRLIADLLVVVLFRILIYRYVHREPIPTIGYAVILVLRFLLMPPKMNDWLLIVVVIVVGPAFEAALIGFGLYVYYNPVLLGMPAWLLIYWVFIVPIFLKGIFDRIESGNVVARK